MDVFEKFLNNYSYKFDKGYPDMNNEQDVLLLESILEELGIDMNESKISKQSIQQKIIDASEGKLATTSNYARVKNTK